MYILGSLQRGTKVMFGKMLPGKVSLLKSNIAELLTVNNE